MPNYVYCLHNISPFIFLPVIYESSGFSTFFLTLFSSFYTDDDSLMAFLCFSVVLCITPRVLWKLSKLSSTELYSSPPFYVLLAISVPFWGEIHTHFVGLFVYLSEMESHSIELTVYVMLASNC